MIKLYRETALEKLSSPDRLDCMLKVSSPLSWVAVFAAALICVAVILWSFLGSIPKTVSGIGVICDPYAANTIYSEYGGTISKILVKPGSSVSCGTPVINIKDRNGNDKTVCSDQNGVVSDILVEVGMTVGALDEIAKISPDTKSSLAAVCYVPFSTAKQLEPGMNANIYLSSSNSNADGYIKAKVINVDGYIASMTSISGVLGADGQLASQIAQSPVVCIICEPEQNGSFEMNYGEPITVQIEISHKAPITMVFPALEALYE